MAKLNKHEAGLVAEQELSRLTAISYDELSQYHLETVSVDVIGPSGISYQVELQVFWDTVPQGNLRIIASVDNGGWSLIMPLSRSELMRPDGSLVT